MLRFGFIGGSTMRGFGLGDNEKSFIDIFKDHHSGETFEFFKDLITAKDALDFFVNAPNLDILVLQIGVADSQRKRNFFLRKATKSLRVYQTSQENNASLTIAKRVDSKHLLSRRGLKKLYFQVIPFKPRTDSELYKSNLKKIFNLASSLNIRVIVLGSVLGKNFISNFEYNLKNSYTRDIFLKEVSSRPSHIRFIDVDLLLSGFCEETDVFHLNSKGHLLLSDLIKDSVKSFEIQG